MLEQLKTQLEPYASCTFVLGLSGGVDSVVLFHLLNTLKVSFRCIHINHQLQPETEDWVVFCEDLCAQHIVQCKVIKVNVKCVGQGVEAAARNARYSAFKKHIKQDEILLTAHHQNDQVETLLLNLMRGSGSAGLAAMPMEKTFAHTIHLRPMLGISRAEVERYALEQQLEYIDDASNQDAAFDRNYLRYQVIPSLVARFPASTKNMAYSAKLFGEQAQALETMAQAILNNLVKHNVLNISAYLTFNAAVRWHLMKAWLKNNELQLSRNLFTEIETKFIHAEADAQPKIKAGEKYLRRFNGQVFITPDFHVETGEKHWCGTGEMVWSGLRFERTDFTFADGVGRQEKPLILKLRQGGETMRLNGQTKHIKKLYQDANVPPWLRAVYPLIFFKGECVGACLNDKRSSCDVSLKNESH